MLLLFSVLCNQWADQMKQAQYRPVCRIYKYRHMIDCFHYSLHLL